MKKTIKFDGALHLHVHHDDSVLAARLAVIDETLKALVTYVTQEGQHMNAQLSELQQLLNDLNGVTNVLSGNVDVVVASEAAQLALIQELRDQVAAGTPVSQAQLDELVAQASGTVTSLQTVSDHLKTIAADPANPVPDVEPVPAPPEV